jgi:glycosyltransferase involved in cell wall biosynthesis
MSTNKLRGALWISDYFPRPHDMTTGTWALEAVLALQKEGLRTSVLAPTPWIPGLPGLPAELRNWSRVPTQYEIDRVPVYYSRCPHYPRSWVNNVLYTKVPFLDTAFLWPWCKRTADEIMNRHPFDVVHANFLFPSGYIGMKIKQRFGTPLVVHERSVQRLGLARDNPGRRNVYRRILREADLVITENMNMASELRQIEPAIAELKVFKQPGSHPDMVESLVRDRPAEFADRFEVLSVGSLSERKGHEYLIRAVGAVRKDIPEIACRIIGAGPKRGELENLIEQLGLTDAVELCGKRPHADVLGEMSWCDVFALPSWGEAGGTVYGEAMQFGKPIIACQGEGITDIAEHHVHGCMVPPRDAEAVAESLRWLYSDATRRDRVAESARKLAVAELGYPKLASALIELYASLAAAGTRKA